MKRNRVEYVSRRTCSGQAARQVLMDRVWGFEAERENRTLDVHIRTLRVKLGAAGSLIETIRGVGYKLGSGV